MTHSYTMEKLNILEFLIHVLLVTCYACMHSPKLYFAVRIKKNMCRKRKRQNIVKDMKKLYLIFSSQSLEILEDMCILNIVGNSQTVL